MNGAEKSIDHLTGLGLNRLEARVYVCLLTHPPMTAYRVARKVGAAAANVYKAIESLGAMGAVLIESGESRLCRAVPGDEFLRQLERGFQERSRKAAESLTRLRGGCEDEGWYKVESAAQILQRAREMLGRAEKIAVVDAFPNALDRLMPSVNETVSRGVEVLVQAYAPVRIPGASVITPQMGEASVSLWQSEQLNLVIDGRECIVALLDRDLERVHQGIWSRSLYLSCILLAGIRSEHTIHRLRACMEGRGALTRMREALQSHTFFVNSDISGQRELMQRFVTGEQEQS